MGCATHCAQCVLITIHHSDTVLIAIGVYDTLRISHSDTLRHIQSILLCNPVAFRIPQCNPNALVFSLCHCHAVIDGVSNAFAYVGPFPVTNSVTKPDPKSDAVQCSNSDVVAHTISISISDTLVTP